MAIYAKNGLTDAAGADSFITNCFITTGAVVWVDSVNGSDSNDGTEANPLATLGAAISAVTASNGDVIVIKSGHTETISSPIALSKAGVKIFGLGSGSDAPNFTVAAAIDCINITGNDCELNNLYFPVGTTAANTSRVNIDARNVRLDNCTFLCGAQDDNSVTITANGIDAWIESCSFTVSADGPNGGVVIENASASGVRISNTSFDGGSSNWDNAAVYSAVAHTNFVYDTVTLTNNASISHTNASSTGIISNAIAGDGSEINA